MMSNEETQREKSGFEKSLEGEQSWPPKLVQMVKVDFGFKGEGGGVPIEHKAAKVEEVLGKE